MKMKAAMLFVALIYCASGFAADKKMVPLPKAPVEVSTQDPVALLHMDQQPNSSEASNETPAIKSQSNRTMDKVRCHINSRYRSCF